MQQISKLTMKAERITPTAEREASFPDAVHWRLAISNERGHILITEYSEGIGHFINTMGQRRTLDLESIIHNITGKASTLPYGNFVGYEKLLTKRVTRNGLQLKVSPPDMLHVLESLALDATALHQSFEDWASDCGYDTDSRKAYAIWEACCESARKLIRLGLDPEKLREELEAREQGEAE